MAKHASTPSRNAKPARSRKAQQGDGAPTGRPPVPLEVYLRYQPWRRRALAIVIVLLLAGLSWADHSGWFLYGGSDWQRYHGQSFRVVRVLDGDTFTIDLPDTDGSLTRVRLWGIDTPETARYDGPELVREAEPFSDEARDFALELAEGQVVRLELESHRMRGRYGRILAFVQLPDGSSLNERLLAAGLAHADTRFLHRDSDRYDMIEAQARADGAGMWGE